MNRRWVQQAWPAIAVGTAIVAVAVAALFGRPVFHKAPIHVRTGRRPGGVGGGGPPEVPSIHQNLALNSRWLVYTLLTLAALGAVILVAATVIAFRSEIQQRVPFLHAPDDDETGSVDGDNTDDVLAAIDAGIVDLADDDADSRAAVIACWVRLERVAEAAGIALAPDGTSSDLVAQLLERQRVSADTLAAMAELYRTARYSSQVIEAPMRDAAREAFQRLRREIAGPRTRIGGRVR
ncbi:MAG TPA: DUF4129 domain-containing protein [Micromonosporaceae bacterium]|jgi:hypothetical protein